MNISCLCDETVSHRSLNVVIIKMNHICMMHVRESDIYVYLPVIKKMSICLKVDSTFYDMYAT